MFFSYYMQDIGDNEDGRGSDSDESAMECEENYGMTQMAAEFLIGMKEKHELTQV